MYLQRSLTCAAFVLSLAACSKQEAAKYDVEEVSLAQISADLAAGKTTSVAVTQAYIDRINKYDPALHAVILIAPNALEQAKAADQRRKDGKTLGPLDGVPIMVKDNIDAVGMPTTAGNYGLVDNMPAQDSKVVANLRAAGAVLMGKLNMNQFAGLRTSAGLLGSTVGGMTRNPYDLTRTPGGSSGGSGVATSASLAAATMGSDTTGSVIGPSNLNGIVGMRPTIALVARAGIVPVSLTQDMSGPMARTVRDEAMLLTVVAGSDARDPASVDADARKTDYTKGLSTDALKGAKIGVYRGTGGHGEKTTPLFDEALGVLKAQGAELVELPNDLLEDMSQEDRTILTHDFKDDLGAYLATATGKIRTVEQLMEFNRTDPRESKHTQDLMEAAAASDGRAGAEYQKILEYAKRRAGPDGFDKGLDGQSLSAIVALTGGPADVIVPEGSEKAGHTISERPKGERPPSFSMNAAIVGYPDLTVPIGLVDGMPIGLSFVGKPWSDAALLAYAYAYEQASKKRAAPTAYKTAAPTDKVN